MSINLWDKKNSGYSYYYDIFSFIYAIKRGELRYDFSFKSKYICGEEISNPIEQNALEKKYNIIYTDNEHPICLGTFESYINKSFFKKYKNIIIDEIRQKIIKETPYSFIIINKYILSTELLKQIIKKYSGQRLIFKNTNLTDEQISLIKENHIYADEITNGIKKSISTNIAYSFYTFDDLEKSRSIVVSSHITNQEIDNFKGMDNLIITIDNIEQYEEDYFNKIIKILDRFEKLNTKFTIRIECKKRSIFDKFIPLIKYNNLSLFINNDYYDYPLDEFIKEEELLYSMVNNIDNSSCTQFEKYIAVYNIVKNFKPYKEVENDENNDLSRNIRYILKNDYMVCVGYSKLFRELLDKVGIEAEIYNTSVDTSYDDGFSLEEKPLNLCRHARIIVNLIDEEYGIDGYYISDPTWDNDLKIDKYSNMIMPFDYMQKSKRLFKLEELDYLFDIHSLDEFNYKYKILFDKKLKQKNRKSNYSKKGYQNIVLDTYYEIISLITQTIKKIDFKKYIEINEIWNNLLYKEENYENLINNYNFFIKYIGVYIEKKSNKELDKNIIIKGIILSKIKTQNILPENLNDFIEFLFKEYQIQENESRPYKFPDNYLDESDTGVKIEKKIL